ncbi:MAG: hypothetical protein V4722_22120 [Bacteroidota bacterium]
MKKLPVILFVFLFVNNQEVAAFNDSSFTERQHWIKRMYGGFAIGGDGVSVSGWVGIIKNTNWGISCSFLSNPYPSENKPDDYKHPWGGFSNVFGTTSDLTDFANIGAILVVREIPFRSKKIRFDVAAGPSVGYHRKLEFISIPEERGSSYTFFSWYSGNYKINTLKDGLPGFH